MHTFKENIHQFYNYSKLRFFSVTTITRSTLPPKNPPCNKITTQCTVYIPVDYIRPGRTHPPPL